MFRFLRLSVVSLALLAGALLFLTGCEGEMGPAGHDGADGENGLLFDWTYVGGDGAACTHCHSDLKESVATTAHARAFDDLEVADQSNPYCIQCHTTGWDSEVAYGNPNIVNYGPDIYGYDDYFGVDGPAAASRRAMLEGVQCEACHGPGGPNPMEFTPALSFATGDSTGTDLSLCGRCHTGQIEEWFDSGHGTVNGMTLTAFTGEFGRSSCMPCHTSEGFILANDPAYATYELPEDYLQNFIGCVTCHDPHAGEAAGGNPHQLRTLTAVEVAYHPGLDSGDDDVPRMEGYGNAQLCAQCHHARRDATNVQNQIDNGNAHFGPHSSPQMDMFIGAGSYEIEGYTYERDHAHNAGIADACVKCHMVRVAEIHGESQDHAFHNFQPTVDNCLPCHTITDFDYNGVQTTVQEMMDDLATRFGFADAAAMLNEDTGWDAVNEEPTWQPWQREAAYALFFVANDGSHGVHNPAYTIDLLQNAMDSYDANDKRLTAK
jgi:formate-dependent nitrite reductase cytochrome c552 subunit